MSKLPEHIFKAAQRCNTSEGLAEIIDELIAIRLEEAGVVKPEETGGDKKE